MSVSRESQIQLTSPPYPNKPSYHQAKQQQHSIRWENQTTSPTPHHHVNKSQQMSERGNRGGRGGGRGRGGGDRGGRGGAAGGGNAGPERKKENILDLNKYMDKAVTVKFNGGREGTF